MDTESKLYAVNLPAEDWNVILDLLIHHAKADIIRKLAEQIECQHSK